HDRQGSAFGPRGGRAGREPMKLNELADRAGARKKRARIGRGIGSGTGKTGGRGGKGQTARSGVRIKRLERWPDAAASPAAEARLSQYAVRAQAQRSQSWQSSGGDRRRQARRRRDRGRRRFGEGGRAEKGQRRGAVARIR